MNTKSRHVCVCVCVCVCEKSSQAFQSDITDLIPNFHTGLICESLPFQDGSQYSSSSIPDSLLSYHNIMKPTSGQIKCYYCSCSSGGSKSDMGGADGKGRRKKERKKKRRGK